MFIYGTTALRITVVFSFGDEAFSLNFATNGMHASRMAVINKG